MALLESIGKQLLLSFFLQKNHICEELNTPENIWNFAQNDVAVEMYVFHGFQP